MEIKEFLNYTISLCVVTLSADAMPRSLFLHLESNFDALM